MSSQLIAALRSAYRRHVEARFAERGWEVTAEVGEALDRGEEWLAAQLEEHLGVPFAEQRRGPLEIFQEAMRFPTDALSAAGAVAVARDDVTNQALPGDVYDLAPASSATLGEEVWRLHLAWGAAKARALRQGDWPVVP